MIVFSCPHCGKNLKVHDHLAGQTGTCKGCGELIQAPAAPVPAETAPAPQFQSPQPQAQDAGIVPGTGIPSPDAQASNPWAQLENLQIDASPSLPPPVVVPGGYGAGASEDYAGFWLRFVAIMIDSVIMSVVAGVFGGVFGFVWSLSGRHLTTPEDLQTFVAVCYLIEIPAIWLYFALCESSSWQATPGKKVFGLQVTTLDGERISFLRATGRFLGRILSGMICSMGYVMAGFTPKKQALHDMIAGCLVVRG